MEDPKILILDISSDEETDNGCAGDAGDGGESGVDSTVDFKWIKKLLDVDDDENEGKGGDSDDLVVVVESDDDDCVILDGDPDKPTVVEEKKGGSRDEVEDDSDDLVVVSEKGEVACRDFPHSRHLCAKFPFSSSGHEIHCDQCHCYVCDSLAPCMYWGTGVSSVDHCHATDKEAFWISQRSSSRRGKVPLPIHVPAVHNNTDISIRRHPVANKSSPLVPNLVEHNHIARQFTVRPCSTPTNSGFPNVIRQGPRPGYVLSGSKYESNLIVKHLADASPHVSSTERRHNNSNMRAPQAVFKRTFPARSTLSSGRAGLNPSSPHYGSRFPTNLPAMHRWKGSHGGISSTSHAYRSSIAGMLSSQTDPVLGNGFSNTMPQMLSQQNRGSGNENGILLQPQRVAQQHISPGYTNYLPQASLHLPVNDLYENSVLPQQLVSPHTPGNANFNASFVSGPQTTYQPDIDYGFMNATHPSHQLTGLTQQNESMNVEYSEPDQSPTLRQFEADTESLADPAGCGSIDPFLPYPSPEYNQQPIISNSHDRLQQENQTIPEGLGSNVAVSDSCPVSCTSPSTQPPGCNSQPQNAEQTDHYSANSNFHHQYPTPSDSGTTDLEAWLSVDHSDPNALGISVPPLLNTPIPSPELASLDVCGLFFD